MMHAILVAALTGATESKEGQPPVSINITYEQLMLVNDSFTAITADNDRLRAQLVAMDAMLLDASPEIARLRALVKEAEWQGVTGRDSDPACPWCRAEPEPIGNELHAPRAGGFRHPTADCPAFTPEGLVK